MLKTYSIGFVIGAALGQGFHKAIGGARSNFNTLGAEIKRLSDQRGLIERFEKDEAALGKARAALSAATGEVNRLKLAMAKAPGDQTARALEKAREKADRLSEAVEKQRGVLRRSEQELKRAGLSVKDLGGQYARLGRTLDDTRRRHDHLERAMARKNAAGQRLTDLRGQMLGTMGGAYGAGRVLGEAINFESAMADVRKTVNFAQPGGLATMGANIKQMSRRIPVSAEGLAQIAASGGQLGIAEADLPGFTETVAKMSTAFDMLPDEAGEAMAKLANVYQIPIPGMTALGDAINHLSDNTAAKARDIVPVLARVGGTARQFGLSAVQVAALGTAFVALGKPPEVAATAINAMLTKLQTATRQGARFQGALEAMGLSAQKLENAIARDGQAALEKFLKQVGAIDKSQRAGLLADLFGMEYSDDISLLTGSLDEYRKALSLVGDASLYAGSMGREFENRSRTTANQIQLLKNSVSVLAINLGATLLPAVNAVIKPISDLSGWAGDMVEKHPRVGKMIGGVALGLGAVVAALTAATAATWVFNAAVVANPIGLVVASIAGAAALIITFWDPIKEYFKTLWEGIKTVFKKGVEYLTLIWETSPLGLLFKAGQKLAGYVGSLFSDSRAVPGGLGASMTPARAGQAGPLLIPEPANVANQATMTVAPTINVSAGADYDQVKAAVSAGMGESEKHFGSMLNNYLSDQRRLAYE